MRRGKREGDGVWRASEASLGKGQQEESRQEGGGTSPEKEAREEGNKTVGKENTSLFWEDERKRPCERK